jgi:hypothetical protein
LPLSSCILNLVGSQLCTRDPFLPSNSISSLICTRSPSFLHHFLCFKTWLTSNWSQELIYNIYSINRMPRYRVWPTQFLTRFMSSWSHQFETFEIQPSSQIIFWDHGEGVWSINLINHGSNCSISFLDRKFLLQFSPKPLNHFASSSSHCVLLSVLFPTVYNILDFIAHDHHHHFRNENFRICPISIFIFNWSPPFVDFRISLLLLNYFSKISLSKLHHNLLKSFLKYNKIYDNFYLSFYPLIKYQLIF